MFVIKHRNFFFAISLFLVLGSLVSLAVFGLKLGTDFKGGSIYEIAYDQSRPTQAELNQTIAKISGIGPISIQMAGDRGVIFRGQTLTEEQKNLLAKNLVLDDKYKFSEKRFSLIGPSLGKELAKKGTIALSLVVVLIVAYIAFVFRQVSRPVRSWKYGVTALIALFHDIIVSIGAMTLLGYFWGIEADALFLTALLTILGLSVNDTIVVFDRIRENLKNKISQSFEETVGISLGQTYARSINTSLTVILVLVAIFLFGAESTKYFALILAIGMTVGTYSSIFIASPLLVTAYRLQEGRKSK